MSDFASLLEKRRALAGRKARLEQELSKNPYDYALAKDYNSISRLTHRYEREILFAAEQKQIDVCRYKIIPECEDYSLYGVTSSLSSFQSVITSIFDAKQSGPKTRARFSEQVKRESELHFGYTFAGSLGFVLVIPSERDLFSGKMDDVVDTFHDLMNVEDIDDVRDISRHLGIAVTSQYYKWLTSNTSREYSLELNWHRSDRVQKGTLLDSNRMNKIEDIILEASDESQDEIPVSGVLVGMNLKTTSGSFHLVVPEGESYSGFLSEEFDRSVQWGLNKRYSAEIIKKEVTYFATEDTKTTFYLKSLKED